MEHEIIPAEIWRDEFGGTFRVMAVAEGCVMLRRPRCFPFVASVAEFRKKYSWLCESNKALAKLRAADLNGESQP